MCIAFESSVNKLDLKPETSFCYNMTTGLSCSKVFVKSLEPQELFVDLASVACTIKK